MTKKYPSVCYRGFEAELYKKALRQAHNTSYDKPLAQYGVDGFAKLRRTHLVASQPPSFCYESPYM